MIDTNHTTTPARRFGWSALSRHAKLQIAGLLGIALYFVYVAAVIQQDFHFPITMFIGVALVLAALVATGLRWTPLLAAIGSAPLLVSLPYRLLRPEQTGDFIGGLLLLALLVVVIGGGIRATIENYRRAGRVAR